MMTLRREEPNIFKKYIPGVRNPLESLLQEVQLQLLLLVLMLPLPSNGQSGNSWIWLRGIQLLCCLSIKNYLNYKIVIILLLLLLI
jgi:hypothetical protein